MRTLWAALVLLPAMASANGTVVNALTAPPDPSGVKVQPSSRVRLTEAADAPYQVARPAAAPPLPTSGVRLREIADELYPLEVRPTARTVFLQSGERLLPFFMIAAAPALVTGLVLGSPVTGVGRSDEGATRLLSGAGLALAAVGVALLLVCTFKMIEHWVDEASGAPTRDARIRELKTERQALLVLQAY